MSAEVHLERQKKADLRAGSSPSAVFAPCVPTVTLISYRELRNKHTALRPQRGSLGPNPAAISHYRCTEGRKRERGFYSIGWVGSLPLGFPIQLQGTELDSGVLLFSFNDSAIHIYGHRQRENFADR
ncbi:hypothetical protein PAMP_000424 [Pampus punctatissimus]